MDSDSDVTTCGTCWLMITLGCCIGPLVSTCYVAGPYLYQAATLRSGGAYYEANVYPDTRPRSETTLVFVPDVYVDTGRVGTSYTTWREGRVYTCVAPLVSRTAPANTPILYWARSRDTVRGTPPPTDCFSSASSAAADVYNRSDGLHAISMGTEYYSPMWGKQDAGDRLDAAKADLLANSAFTSSGLRDANHSVYLSIVSTHEGTGSVLAYFESSAAPGIFWMFAVPGIVSAATIGLLFLLRICTHCDETDNWDGNQTRTFWSWPCWWQWLLPGIAQERRATVEDVLCMPEDFCKRCLGIECGADKMPC